jgi:hypothetical protein
MKKLFFALLMILCFVQVDAQYSKKQKEKFGSKYGIKLVGGAILARSELTEVGNKEDNYVIHQIQLNRTLPQISFGLFGQKKFGWLYAEGSVLYSSYGMVFDVTSFVTEEGPSFQLTEKFGYVDLQVMGGLTSHGFRISVGPVMHILANHNSELANLENYNQNLRKTSYGFSGALGYDIGRFCFDLKYDKAFRTVGDHIYYGDKKSLFLETPDALSLSVAFAIIK